MRKITATLRAGGRLLLFDANWNMPLYDEDMAKRAEERRQECLRQYGDALETADDITEPFDPLQLPLSGTKRPYWDVELLRKMGFGGVCLKDIDSSSFLFVQ